MKQYLGIVLSLLLSFGFLKTKAQLVADFGILNFSNTEISSGCAPLITFLSDSSTINGAPVPYRSISGGNAYNSHQWFFGNGNVSTLYRPSNLYTAGTYNITLVVTNNGVNYDTVVQTLTVNPEPVVNFTVDVRDGCDPLVVNFCDSSTNTASIVADMGDGTLYFDSCFSHTFTRNNLTGQNCFSITWVATSTFGCSKSLTRNNFICIDLPPIADFYADQAVVCDSPYIVSFHDSSYSINTLTYSWQFGDGGISTLKDPVHTYADTGNYTVTLIVTDTSCNLADTIIKPNYIRLKKGSVAFSLSDSSICAGEQTSFFAITEGNIDSLFWSFGVSGLRPSNDTVRQTFSTAGSYSITLTGTNTAGCVYDTTLTNILVVHPRPSVNFTASQSSSCQAPFTANFTGTSNGAIVWWVWAFDYPANPPGSTNSTPGPNASYTYNAPGAYDVRLTVVSDYGCMDSIVKPNYINIAPTVVSFSTDTTQGCVPLPIQFTNTSTSPDPIISWVWDFGDATPIANGPNQNHTYTVPGTYNACLSIITTTGCRGFACRQINTGLAPTASFSANPLTVCVNEPISFFNTSTGNITGQLWDFGNSTTDPSITPAPYAYDDPGNYTITLTVNDNGCSDDTSVAVIVNDPKADFTYTTSCQNAGTYQFTDASINADTYFWDFGDSQTSTQQNPLHTYTQTGTYTVTLTVTNFTTGCTAVKTVTLTVSVFNVDWTANRYNGCAPLTVNFSSLATGNGLILLWDFGDIYNPGTNTSRQPNVAHTYTEPGTYTVSLFAVDADSCTATKVRVDTINVSGAAVDFTASPNAGCLPSSGLGSVPVQFNDISIPVGAAAIVSQVWDFGALPNGFGPSPIHNYVTAGTYDVKLTVTNDLGCVTSRTKPQLINIFQPRASFNTGLNLYCPGQPIQFSNTSTGANLTYRWNFGDPNTNADTSALRNPQYVYNDTGLYNATLWVTDAYGCRDSFTLVPTIRIDIPSLRFVADDTFRYCPPHIVNFSNFANLDTVNVRRVYWDFGDNSYSTLFNPSHIYNQAGLFTVKVVVEFVNGCIDSLIYPDYINVGGVVGNITVVPDTGCVPLDVCFDANTDGSATSCYWLFGNGDGQLICDSVCYTYNQPGYYLPGVILVDGQNPACQYILPYDDTIWVDTVFANFTFSSDSVCQVAPVQFNDSSYTLLGKDIVRWEWDFGDGQTDTVQNPVHFYYQDGTMNVTLRAYSEYGCFSEVVKTIFVLKRPEALFTVDDSVGCEILTAIFRDSSIAGDGMVDYWRWDFGDYRATNDTSLLQNPGAYFYGDTGIYYPTLIVEDDNGCRDTSTRLIGVYPNPNGISGADSIEICIYDTIRLQGDSSYVFWDWTPGIWLSDSTIAQPLAYPQATTMYTLLTRDRYGCETLDSITIIVNPLPTLTVSPSPDTIICFGDTIQLSATGSGIAYLWSPNEGLSDEFIPNPLASPRRTITYQVYTVDSNACNTTDTVKIHVNVFHTYWEGERVCLGDSTDFVDISTASDFPITQWNWNFDDPTSGIANSSTDRNPSHFYADSGIYRVELILTDLNGCTDTLAQPIRVDHPALPIAGPDTIVCFGNSVQLFSSGGEMVYWWPPSGLDNPNTYNPVASPSISTIYIAHLTNGVCPYDTAHAVVEVVPTPLLTIDDTYDILRGSSITLNAGIERGNTIVWTPADSLSCTTCTNPIANPLESIIYTVTVTDTFGCTNTKQVAVNVDSKCSEDQIFVGNGFTPNNDGINDVAYARLYGLKGLKYFRIFDRWGALMFETRNESEGWEGKNKNGQQLNSGVYVYVVEAECFNGKTIVKTGNVTLIK
ncbi:MAG: PKD domain-containing protein [Chitinophagales bacterium]|nr:PKD domain-containing protein [Chitinophagales bacterium]